MRSTRISRWSSPIPLITVWPDFLVGRRRGTSDPRAASFCERDAHLLLVGLRLRLDRDLDDRLRELHPLEDDRASRSQSVSPVRRALEPDERHDVARAASLISSRLLACMSRMRPMRSRWSLTVLCDTGAALEHARVDAHEGERADEGIAHDLEGERRHRLGVVGRRVDPLVGPRLQALHRRQIDRRRQEVHDRVEQRLHTLVLEGRAAEHRDELVADRALAQQPRRSSPRPARRRRDRPPSPRRRTRRRPRAASARVLLGHEIGAGRAGSGSCDIWRRASPRARSSACCGSGRRRPGTPPRRRSASDDDGVGAQAIAGSCATQRSKFAPIRSILLTKQMRGTRYLSACRQTVSDCGSTPATAVEHRDGAVEHAQASARPRS